MENGRKETDYTPWICQRADPYVTCEHDGKLFMTFSASDTSSAYCVGLLSARSGENLLDPGVWTKWNHPVFQSDPEHGLYDPNRHAMKKVVEWDETGMPVFQ